MLALIPWAAAYGQFNALLPDDLYLDAIRSILEGRQSDAIDSLTRLIKTEPQHAGALLDLAIIQCQLGRSDEAQRLFLAIETKFSPPPGIREVISRYRAQGCIWLPHQHVSVQLGRGSDSNVNQGSTNSTFSIGTGDYAVGLQLLPDYLPKRDGFTALATDYARDIDPDGTVAFGQFRARRDDKLSSYDTSSVMAGVEHPWRFADWKIRGSGILTLTTLGGRLYQRQTQLQARVLPNTPLPSSLQLSMVSGVAHSEYPGLTGFDSNIFELRGVLDYRTDHAEMQAVFGYLFDEALGKRPGGNRNGSIASLQGRVLIGGILPGELAWTRLTWQGSSVYSPGLIDVIRRENTSVWRGTLVIPVDDRQSIDIDWRDIHNVDNLSIFKYDSRLLQISWKWRKSW